MSEYLSRTRSKVHALSRGLLPIEIESHGLRTALDYLVASTAEVHGIECRLDCASDIDTGNKVLTNHLVRIAQESIQNAVKHADTDTIDVAVMQQGGRITLTVTDYGSGFVADRDALGVGLRLMRHRAATIGADLSVVSKPGKGTRVRCECRL
jgi:signal transduction histidine kinase